MTWLKFMGMQMLPSLTQDFKYRPKSFVVFTGLIFILALKCFFLTLLSLFCFTTGMVCLYHLVNRVYIVNFAFFVPGRILFCVSGGNWILHIKY